MGAEALLREVQERRKKALEQLQAEYSLKKTEISKRAADETTSISDWATTEGSAQAEREKTRISGAAKLKAKKMVFDSTEKMLENNIMALRQALADYGQSKEYPEELSRMFEHASKRLGEGVGVICRAEDSATLKRAGAKIISSNLVSIGGFKAESANGDLELDLTFEDLLRDHEEETRAYILGKE